MLLKHTRDLLLRCFPGSLLALISGWWRFSGRIDVDSPPAAPASSFWPETQKFLYLCCFPPSLTVPPVVSGEPLLCLFSFFRPRPPGLWHNLLLEGKHKTFLKNNCSFDHFVTVSSLTFRHVSMLLSPFLKMAHSSPTVPMSRCQNSLSNILLKDALTLMFKDFKQQIDILGVLVKTNSTFFYHSYSWRSSVSSRPSALSVNGVKG